MTFPRLLVILLATFFSNASAQRQYYTYHSVDFRWDTVNNKYLYGTQLGAVLLWGYLRGDLKAYTFDIKTDYFKFKPLPAEAIPAAWDRKMDYFAGDRVTFKGKYYQCIMDITQAEPEGNEAWYLLNLTGVPASIVHSFPTEADTTTKAAFLSKFIQYEDEFMGDRWDPTYDYYSGDIAEFNGQYYYCLVDNKDRRPDNEKDYWRIRQRQVTFHVPNDLYGASLLYAGNDDSKLVPQMLQSHVMNDNYGAFWSALIYKFQDVMAFLSQQPELPLICRSTYGYTGTPQMIIGNENANYVLHYLQSKLVEKKLAPDKKGILSTAAYDGFMNYFSDDLTMQASVMQDINTNDIIISSLRTDSTGATYTKAVKLAWKSVESLLAADVPAPRTWGYMDGLQSKLFHYYSPYDTISYDTLEPMPYKPVTLPAPTERYFIDQRAASIASNPKLAQAIQSLWSQLRRAIEAGQITPQPNEVRPFLCDQPFPAMVVTGHLTWEIAEGFRLESIPEITLDPKLAQLPASGIVAEYRRVLTAPPSKVRPFAVQRIGIRLFYPEVGAYIDYYFKWDDVKKIIGGQKDMKALVEAVENGTLTFDSQNVIGGLIGVNR